MSEKKILHLTLIREWFERIARGEKKKEYREIKPYWTKRLLKKSDIKNSETLTPIVYDEVHFRNGYDSKCPFMRVEWKGLIIEPFQGNFCYTILLAEVLEVKNWES
jgi:hypothetical protein